MMFDRKRLHPVAMLLSFISSIREAALPLIFFVFVGRGGYSWWHFVAIGGLLVFTLVNGVMGWLFYTYQIQNNELRIHQGFIFRKKRFIPRERIQSIDFSQGVIQRLFGLVKVQIETAGGGGEPEVVMPALRRLDAERLKEELYDKKSTIEEVDEEVAPVLMYKLTWRQLLIAASTSGGIGVVLSFVAAIGSQLDDLIPDEFYTRATETILDATIPLILITVAFILILSWIFSVAGTVLKYGGFVLSRQENDLLIHRGVLEKRQLTIPVQRIQAIRVVEGLLRQPFGYAAIYVESGGGGGKDEQFSTVLYPLMKRKHIKSFLEEVLPEIPIHNDVESLPTRARRRYMIRFTLPTLIPIGVLSYFIPYGYISILLIPLACLIGYLHYRDAGWSVKKGIALLQFRQIGRTRVYVARRRIQAMEMQTTYFQKRRLLTTFQLSILSSFAGKQFRVRDIEQFEGHSLLDWYSYEASERSIELKHGE
ncbi:PH domain-containing protein [Guptibacillus hwajinpoensis]|uniref:Membrane protein n=1 Tax=Guptibacillus hwajinpoensis TaxID=208199 RepID=A0ABU0K6G7_9BACL|nr:PH domain-containing protein [Alkalihalobacillus hemicentroti]MDQ0484970.1 putative membrane protein [Alkalihalobacillus hemicentroti]